MMHSSRCSSRTPALESQVSTDDDWQQFLVSSSHVFQRRFKAFDAS